MIFKNNIFIFYLYRVPGTCTVLPGSTCMLHVTGYNSYFILALLIRLLFLINYDCGFAAVSENQNQNQNKTNSTGRATSSYMYGTVFVNTHGISLKSSPHPPPL